MPRSAAPASYADFRAAFDAWLHSDEPYLVDEARIIGRHIAGVSGYGLPLRLVTSPALATVVQGGLPPVVREHYGIRWGLPEEARWQAASRGQPARARGAACFRGPPLFRGRSQDFYKVVQRG